MSKVITVKIHSIHSVPQATRRFGTKLSNSQCKGGKLTNYRIHNEKQSHGLVDSRTGHCAVRWCPQQCNLMWTHSTPVSVHFSWTQKHIAKSRALSSGTPLLIMLGGEQPGKTDKPKLPVSVDSWQGIQSGHYHLDTQTLLSCQSFWELPWRMRVEANPGQYV